MRVCCALEPQQQALQLFSAAAFDAYFAEGNNIDDPAVLARVADRCDLDGNSLIEQASQQSIKDQLRANTGRRLRLAPTDHPLCLSLTSCILATISYPLLGKSYCVGRVTNPRSSRRGNDT
jgi:hypothetical protein